MLVAPTELRHPALRALATSGRGSNKTERYGVDFMFTANKKWYGVQRKELRDFISSVSDDRLYKEVMQMQELEQAVLVLEGVPRWDLNGTLMLGGRGQRWTRQQHYAYLLSVRAKGIWVEWTQDVDGTAEFILAFESWVKKEKHKALETRAGVRTPWGTAPSQRDFQRHLLMSFHGVSVERANMMLDAFGGTGLEWKVTEQEMLAIPGIGPKTVKLMRETL